MFRAKLEELKNGLFKKEIFGPVAAYLYVLQLQKRGLPYVHFLIILKSGSKILLPEAFDRIVSAELLDESKNPYLFLVVVKQMMHGPCGILNPKNVCIKKNGKCKNHYPKEFCLVTTQGRNSYPINR